MKKVLSLVIIAILLTLSCTALAASPKKDHIGEIISQQASFCKEDNLSSRITYLKNGETFYIQANEENGWYYVAVEQDDGSYKFGYVQSAYVVQDPKHVVIRTYSGDRGGTYAYVNPHITNKRVGTVNSYDRFTVIAEDGNYYVVSFRNAICYLDKRAEFWIEEDLKEVLAKKGTAYLVDADKTPIYGFSDGKHKEVTTLNAGRTIRVLYKENGYYAFKYNTTIAFIKQDAVTKK